MDACYVCYETHTPLLRDICDCRTARIHPECQQRLLDVAPQLCCKVCSAPYRNVRLEYVHECHPTVLTLRRLLVITATASAGQLLLYACYHTPVLLAMGCMFGATHLFFVGLTIVTWRVLTVRYADRIVVMTS